MLSSILNSCRQAGSSQEEENMHVGREACINHEEADMQTSRKKAGVHACIGHV